jgi:hypothetical protein
LPAWNCCWVFLPAKSALQWCMRDGERPDKKSRDRRRIKKRRAECLAATS